MKKLIMIMSILALVAFSSCAGEKSQDNSSTPTETPGGGGSGEGDGIEPRPSLEPQK